MRRDRIRKELGGFVTVVNVVSVSVVFGGVPPVTFKVAVGVNEQTGAPVTTGVTDRHESVTVPV